MAKILLIEDDTDLFSLLQYNLERDGFAFAGTHSGSTALQICRQVRPDLVLLDIMLPDSDGLDICRGIRSDSDLAAVPIIFLTARAAEADRIEGLGAGANDYVVKPFSVRELIARIRLQLRDRAEPIRVLQSGDIELDRVGRQLRFKGVPLSLTSTEFRLLEFLMTQQGVVFSREQLLDAVWGQNHALTDRAVDVYVMRLREKLEGDRQNPVLIHSVRGFGYTFDPRRNELRPRFPAGNLGFRQS